MLIVGFIIMIFNIILSYNIYKVDYINDRLNRGFFMVK